MGTTVGSIIVSMAVLFSSAVAAIVVAIIVLVKMQRSENELDEADA